MIKGSLAALFLLSTGVVPVLSTEVQPEVVLPETAPIPTPKPTREVLPEYIYIGPFLQEECNE